MNFNSPISILSCITSSGMYEHRNARIAAGSKSSSSSVNMWSTNGLLRIGSFILFTKSANRYASCHKSDRDAQCNSSCPKSLLTFVDNESVIVCAFANQSTRDPTQFNFRLPFDFHQNIRFRCAHTSALASAAGLRYFTKNIKSPGFCLGVIVFFFFINTCVYYAREIMNFCVCFVTVLDA